MFHRFLALLALVIVLFAIAGLSLTGAGSPNAEDPTTKLADRVLYYQVGHERGPRFRVSGEDQELRFLTHVLVPSELEYDPRQVFSYGLRFVVRSPEGNELWRKEVFTESRQSKAGIDLSGWRLENTYSADRRRQFTDDRTVRISLPPEIPSLSELEVTVVSERDTALVRAYRLADLGPAQRWVAALGVSVGERARLFRRVTYLPWEALSDGQRSWPTRSRWERMSAEGEPGRDYSTETVYFTGFRTSYHDRATTDGLKLSSHRDAALALHGPIEVDFLAIGGCAPRFVGATVQVQHLDGAGRVVDHSVSTCPGELSLTLPAGPHSLRLSLQGSDGPLFVHSFHHTGDPETGGVPLGMDLRSLSVYRIGPNRPIFETTLATFVDLDARVLGLSARRLLPESPLVSNTAWDANVFYEFRSASGNLLASGRWPLAGDMPASFLDTVVVPRDERTWLPSDPVTTRVLAPWGSRQIKIWADQDVALSVSSYLHGPENGPSHALAPYDDFLTSVRWRFAPLARRTWYPLRATNHVAFEAASAAAKLLAPVRLELAADPWLDPKPADTTNPDLFTDEWVSVAPTRVAERQIVLDRDQSNMAPDEDQRVYTRIPVGERIPVSVRDLRSTHLIYVGDLSAVGQTVAVALDGEWRQHTMVSLRGRWRLPIETTGSIDLQIESEGNVRFFVDRPTDSTKQRFVQRTLYRLGPAGTTLALDTAGDSPLYVNAVVYTCSTPPESVRLQAVLDGGTPSRRAGQPFERLTQAQRFLDLTAPGRPSDLVFLARAAGPCSEMGHVVLPIGNDIAAGPHEFQLRVLQGHDIWARFFHHGTSTSAPHARQWIERNVSDMESELLSDD